MIRMKIEKKEGYYTHTVEARGVVKGEKYIDVYVSDTGIITCRRCRETEVDDFIIQAKNDIENAK